jgi:4-amino-4-deoxy-L-arabinose transferase-like glycosyltransferase
MSASIASHLPNEQQSKSASWLTAGRWPVLASIALAFGLRLINLGGRPLWYDEAFAVLYAEKPFGALLYGTLTRVEGAAADVHPLFFYSILHAWMGIVGQSPLAVRALSALLGTATVVVTYLLACRLFDRRTGLAAAVIVAVAPFPIYYSQEARMYALLGLAAITTAYFFVRAWAGGRKGDWIAFGFFGALTLYAHNLGFAFIAGLDLWIAWTWLRPGLARDKVTLIHLRPVLLSHLLMVGLFAPWLAIVPSQFGKIQQSYWVPQPGLAQIIQTILIFHFAYDNQSLPGWLLPPALFFSLMIMAVVTVELVRAKRQTSNLQSPISNPLLLTPYSLLLFLTLTPPILTFVVSQFRPVFIVRALLPSALAYYVLIAGVLVAGAILKPVKWGLLLPSAAIVALSLVNHYTYAQFPRSPFDQAAAFLRSHYQPADVIVHSNKLTFFPTYYYDRALPQTFIADEPGSPSDSLAYPTQQALGLFAIPDIATATQRHERVWFIIFRRAIDEYRAAGYADHPQRIWLEQHYKLVSVTSFNDLDVYEYESGPLPAAFIRQEEMHR